MLDAEVVVVGLVLVLVCCLVRGARFLGSRLLRRLGWRIGPSASPSEPSADSLTVSPRPETPEQIAARAAARVEQQTRDRSELKDRIRELSLPDAALEVRLARWAVAQPWESLEALLIEAFPADEQSAIQDALKLARDLLGAADAEAEGMYAVRFANSAVVHARLTGSFPMFSAFGVSRAVDRALFNHR